MAKKKNKGTKNKKYYKNPSERNEESKKKKETPKEPSPVILKADIHCEGCASKLTKLARSFPGVQSARGEMGSGKVIVVGPVDPLQLRDFIAQKARKKIEVVSPLPAKADEGKKKDEEKDVKKPAEGKTEKNQKTKEASFAMMTSVIKINLHCQGCIEKIYKIVWKTKGKSLYFSLRLYLYSLSNVGVLDVLVDKQKETITVKGSMDVAALANSLKEKLKRNAEVVPSKEKEKEEKENKEKPEDNGGGGKKDKNTDVAETATIPENRLGFMAGLPGFSGGPSFYGPLYFPPQPPCSFVQPGQIVWVGQNSGSEPGYGIPVIGYPPHMKFNDENPNACSVM